MPGDLRHPPQGDGAPAHLLDQFAPDSTIPTIFRRSLKPAFAACLIEAVRGLGSLSPEVAAEIVEPAAVRIGLRLECLRDGIPVAARFQIFANRMEAMPNEVLPMSEKRLELRCQFTKLGQLLCRRQSRPFSQ